MADELHRVHFSAASVNGNRSCIEVPVPREPVEVIRGPSGDLLLGKHLSKCSTIVETSPRFRCSGTGTRGSATPVSAADEATGRYCVRAPPEGGLVPGTIKAWIVTGAHAIFGHWIPDQAVRRNIWRIMERTEKQKRQSASH